MRFSPYYFSSSWLLVYFPLGVGSDDETLKKIAPGVVWIAALLASTLALDRLFSADYEDGTLEQIVLAPSSLSVSVFAKTLAHWLLTGLPLVLISPLVGLFYHLPVNTIWVMMFVLLLGTPVLSMLGAIAAALTLGLTWWRCVGFAIGITFVYPSVGLWCWGDY